MNRHLLHLTGLALTALLSGALLSRSAAQSDADRPASKLDHWSFKPVVRAPVPGVADSQLPNNAIDSFVRARLEGAGLTPAPAADRPTLIRRLTFDLLGLPPTPEEVDAFVADKSADAYDRLVERYLAAPQYGERWARHWLDVVRFAESDGFETNQPRVNAWPYRDWVIQALNDDLPYDRIVSEQLAGDALGADAATGFLVGGTVDRVKSPDPGLTAQQRADELHDMVSTASSAFLGLTVGCARCHDHKFDPILMTDYYAMKAIFAGVHHGERPDRGADLEKRRQEAAELRRQIAKVSAELEALEPLAQPGGPPGRRAAVNTRRNVERIKPVLARFVRFTVLATNSAEPCLDELEVFSVGPDGRNVALASAGSKATASGTLPGHAIHKLEHINDGGYGNSRSWISNEVGRGWVQIELKEPVRVDRIVWGRDREGKFLDRVPTKYRIEIATNPDTWTVVATADDRSRAGLRPQPPAPGPPERTNFQRLTEEREELERRLTQLKRPTLVYAGTFAAPEPTFRLHRGEALQKREAVARPHCRRSATGYICR